MIDMWKRERMIISENHAGLSDHEAYLKSCAQEGNPVLKAFTEKQTNKQKKLTQAKTQMLWYQIDK